MPFFPTTPPSPACPLQAAKQVQKPGKPPNPKGNTHWVGPCLAWAASGTHSPGPQDPAGWSLGVLRWHWGLGLEDGRAGRQTANSTGMGGVTLEQAEQWRGPQWWGRGISQLGSVSLEVWGWGALDAVGSNQGRNGSGSLGLASQTQVDMGVRGGRLSPDTAVPQVMPVQWVGGWGRSGAEGIPRPN